MSHDIASTLTCCKVYPGDVIILSMEFGNSSVAKSSQRYIIFSPFPIILTIFFIYYLAFYLNSVSNAHIFSVLWRIGCAVGFSGVFLKAIIGHKKQDAGTNGLKCCE